MLSLLCKMCFRVLCAPRVHSMLLWEMALSIVENAQTRKSLLFLKFLDGSARHPSLLDAHCKNCLQLSIHNRKPSQLGIYCLDGTCLCHGFTASATIFTAAFCDVTVSDVPAGPPLPWCCGISLPNCFIVVRTWYTGPIFEVERQYKRQIQLQGKDPTAWNRINMLLSFQWNLCRNEKLRCVVTAPIMPQWFVWASYLEMPKCFTLLLANCHYS